MHQIIKNNGLQHKRSGSNTTSLLVIPSSTACMAGFYAPWRYLRITRHPVQVVVCHRVGYDDASLEVLRSWSMVVICGQTRDSTSTRGLAARHRVLVRAVVDSGSLKNIQVLGGRDGRGKSHTNT